MDVKESVQRQFGDVAASYSTSAVHVSGPELLALLDAHPFSPTDRVMDAGTGTGHTALAVAPLVAEVVAVDLTPSMLEQGRTLAAERGITNVQFATGDIEHLEFADGSFDVVVSRYSAHHYPHPARAVAEIARVLKPGGVFLLADVISPDNPTADTYMNAIEVMRDPSHVRDHRVDQWQEMFERAGFVEFAELGRWPLRMLLETWTTRMNTPAATAAEIRRLLDIAPHEVREALHVEPDYHFSIPVALMRGRTQG
jgi:ubiquinone/menaquinone biosynthesis C-methylase UbiE